MEGVRAISEMLPVVDSPQWDNKDGWTLMVKPSNLPIRIYRKNRVQAKGMTLIGTVKLTTSARTLLDHILDVENYPSFNKDVITFKRTMIGKQCDLVYSAWKQQGPVYSRDFVSARAWRKLGRRYVVGLQSTTSEIYPEVPDRVRGWDYPSIEVIEKLPDKRVLYTYSVNTDLKGYLSKTLTDQMMHNVVLDYLIGVYERMNKAKP